MSRFANRSGSSLNAALWLAVGTAAGVLVGVTLADRAGGKKLLRRITGALGIFESLKGQFDRIADRRVPASDVPFDDDLDDDDDEVLESVDEDEELSPAYDAADDEEDVDATEDDEDDVDATENEGSGFEPDTDEEYIDERVLAAFEQDPILSERDIEIDEPEPAVIALTGRVATAKDAKHAVTIARGVPGVERVENRIRIIE